MLPPFRPSNRPIRLAKRAEAMRRRLPLATPDAPADEEAAPRLPGNVAAARRIKPASRPRLVPAERG